MSSSINLNVRIAPNNGAGYAFNQAILYRRYNAMPMLPTDESKKIAEAFLADSVVYDGVKADTFRLSRMTDTLLLHSTDANKEQICCCRHLPLIIPIMGFR